ncbi:MAG: galactose mutarotase [Oscillospiraceae bacterium]|nr:galactose mutarotase [Oscillospiraceae bacterium]
MTKTLYATMPDGRPVEAFTLDNGLLRAEILTFGAALNRLFAPDRDGKMENVLSAFESLEERMARSQYQGEVVGRCANRIKDAKFTLHGQEYQVTPNEKKNGNCLHGGGEFSRELWQVNPIDATILELTFGSPAGAHGFPGHVTARVCYTLQGSALVIEYRAGSDADTVLNLTNHAYFNLAAQGNIFDHILQIDAEHYLPINEKSIPTGELRPVKGTAFDFTSPKPIGQDIFADDPQLTQVNGYDHNYCITQGSPDPAVVVCEPISGRKMSVITDLPGVQLYTGNNLPVPHTAFCLETQAWPDSPNQWPEQCLLKAGEDYRTTTRFEFSTHL